MDYVDKSLLQDEKILYRATVTRYVYLRCIIWLIIGIPFTMRVLQRYGDLKPGYNAAFLGIGVFITAIGIVSLVRAFIARTTTELAVTSKRIIAKYGFFSRKTIELNHSKFESLSVNQGVLGRILNYGNITVSGTGGGKTPIKGIDDPLRFRDETVMATE